MNEIEQFIEIRFSDTDAHWFDGNCYYFAVILNHRFPELQIYYEPITGHFVAGDGNNFYDAHGKYETEYTPILYEKIIKEEPSWNRSIYEGCIK